MSDNLPKYKPIYTDGKKSIIFDRNLNPLKHRPIIIFYDDYYDEYFYIKARSAYDANGNKKEKYQGEIFIPAANKGLLTKDSYVDTTQIFSIKRIDLEKIVDKNSHIFLTTNHFTKNQIREISKSLISNLLDYEPPLVSFVEVHLKNNKPLPNLKYCHKKFWNEITNLSLVNYVISDELNEDLIWDLRALGAEVRADLKDFEHTWKSEENEIIEQIEREEEDEMEM
ncbi:Mbov_0400 family ICE element protein [[Mycoplasma] collis]|uniref:Mbov_0400 family ICE element protein n=1 Tax=[Mycoplasma] collis TaxID=2127 RepID=UPI00051B151B|nr:hypothetical protein [[Mycoplasma] collis]